MFFGMNLDGVFMPDFTTKLKKKCAALRLYLYICWNRFCRQSTSGSCLILLQNFKTKKGQRSACTSMFFGTGFAGRVPAHIRFRISFYLVLELKTKTKKLLHTAVPKFLQEFLPEFHSSLDAGKKKRCCALLCRPPKARWRFRTAGPLDIYIYI